METESQATFKEVLQIEADLKAFEASLAQIKSAYQSFIADLNGQAAEILGVGMFAAMKDELAAITKGVNEVLGVSLQLTEEFTEKKDAVEEQAEQKRRQRIKESAAQEVKAAEEVAAAKKALLESGVSAEQFASMSPSQKMALEINQEQEALINAYVDAIAVRQMKSKEAWDKEVQDATLAAQAEADAYIAWWEQAVGKREIREREASARDEAADQRRVEAYINWWERAIRLREIKEAEQEKREQERADRRVEREAAQAEKSAAKYVEWWERALARRDELQSKVEDRKRNTHEEISLGIQGSEDREAERAEKTQAALNQEIQRTVDLTRKLSFASFGDDLAGKLRALKARFNEVAQEIEKLKAAASATDNVDVRLSGTKQLNQLLAEQNELQNKINSVQSQMDRTSQGFFDKLGQGWINTASHMLKVYAVWTSIMAVQQAFAAAVELPFKVLSEGTKYLDDIQKSADKLTGSMSSNVKFSDDFIENLKMAGEASREAIIALHDIASQTGLSFDHLEDTFRSLVTAGAAANVQTTRELVTLAQILNIANEQVKGDANLRGLLSDIPKLFNGTLQKGSAFLEVTHLTAQEAKDLVKSTKEHQDLLAKLEPLFAPYLSAAEQAKLHHQNIVASLDQQIKRFEALVASPVYSRITEIVKSVLDFIDQNKSLLADLAKVLGEIALDVEKMGEKLLGVNDGAKGLVLSFSLLVNNTAYWLELLTTGAAMLLKISSMVTPGAKKLDLNPDNYEKDADGNPDLTRRKAGKPGLVSNQSDLEQLEDLFRTMKEAQKRFTDYQTQIQRAFSAIPAPAGFVGPFPEGSNFRYQPASSLDLPIGGKGEHPSLDKDPRRRFDAQGSFQEEVAFIRESYDQIEQEIKDGEASLVLSKREAAKALADYSEQEILDIRAAGERFRAAMREYYGKQIADGKATPEDRDDALRKFDASQINAERQIRDRVRAAARQGQAEANKIEETQLRNQLALQKEIANEELAISRDKYSQGKITEQQYLNEKAQIEQKAFFAEVQAIEDELSLVNAGTERYAQLQAQKALLEQRYTGQVKQGVDTRLQARQKEEDAARKHDLALYESALQANTLQVEIAESVKTVHSAYVDVFSIRDKEISAKIREVQIELQLAAARKQTVESTRHLREQLASLNNERLSNLQSQIQTIQGSNESSVLKQIDTRAAIRAARSSVILQGVSDSSPEAQQEFNKQLKELTDLFAKATPSLENSLESLERKFLGMTFKEFKDRLDEASDSTEKFALGLDAGLKLLTNISSFVNNVQTQYQKGGVLGGAGAALSEASQGLGLLQKAGIFKSLSKSLPLVGEALGGVLEFIGPLFTKAAEHIANEVKKSFQKTMSDFQAGNATLQQTLDILERQRISAISQLSGKKGGQDKLDELLPQFDQQIQSLRSQQRQIIESFNQALKGLELQSDTLSQIQQQWTQIVKTVKEYLDAGGDATAATKYLSAELEKIQADAQAELDDANQQAIRDAISLNDLLQQRAALVKDFEKQKFDLLNADSLERRQAGAVSRGRQLKDLEEEQAKKLADIDAQINLTNRKLALEGQVFDLSGDIASLHRMDEDLSLKALEGQVGKWRDLKGIIDSIHMQPDGIFSSNSPLLNRTTSITVTVGPVYGGGEDLAKDVGDSVYDAVTQGLRSGSGDY